MFTALWIWSNLHWGIKHWYGQRCCCVSLKLAKNKPDFKNVREKIYTLDYLSACISSTLNICKTSITTFRHIDRKVLCLHCYGALFSFISVAKVWIIPNSRPIHVGVDAVGSPDYAISPLHQYVYYTPEKPAGHNRFPTMSGMRARPGPSLAF